MTLVERLRKRRDIEVEWRNGLGFAKPDPLCAEAVDRIETLEAENARLREAVQVLRNGYADAAAGLAYVLNHHGRLYGVGFDRVADNFFAQVTMPEREGLLAGSHTLSTLASPCDHPGAADERAKRGEVGE